MTLTQSRALCANVQHADHQPARDRRALEAMGRWLMRFTPSVSLTSSELSLENEGIFLDISGCDRLFGSVDNIVRQVDFALNQLGITSRLAVAPTPGAAWALASHGKPGQIASADDLLDLLSPLPARALRLSPELAGLLHHLGLERIGQVIDLPRELLPARFGPELLLRVDQALGRIAEPMVPLQYCSPITARIDFDGEVFALEAIWLAFQELIGQIVVQLTRRGCGARRLDVQLLHFHAPPTRKSILLSRANRDPANLFNLFRCALEDQPILHARSSGSRQRGKRSTSAVSHWASLDLHDEGYSGMVVHVPIFEAMSTQQISLLGEEQYQGQIELDRLIERLRVRLGEQSVARVERVESHLPERAWQMSAESLPARDGAVKTVRPVRNKQTDETARTTFPLSARPLWLFSPPIEIRVMVSPSDDADGQPAAFTHYDQTHVLVHAVGPERIAGRWWEGHDKTRDYFDVEDTTAGRHWLFRVRETGRWFLHGRFV